MSKLTRASQSIKSIINNLRARLGHRTKHYFLPSLHHALDGYLIGHIPTNVFEIRPPSNGLISLTIAQISKSSSYFMFTKDHNKKILLEKTLGKTNLKFQIRMTQPHEMLRNNKLPIPDLVIINEITNQTIADDIDLLTVLIQKIKRNYQSIGLFVVLSPELSAGNWYALVRLMETNAKPFTFISDRVLAGRLNIK